MNPDGFSNYRGLSFFIMMFVDYSPTDERRRTKVRPPCWPIS